MKPTDHAHCSALATPRAKTHKAWRPSQLTHSGGEARADRLERHFHGEYTALVNRVTAGEQLPLRSLIGHDSQLSRAALAERTSREASQGQAGAADMLTQMNVEHGIRSLRAALGECNSEYSHSSF